MQNKALIDEQQLPPCPNLESIAAQEILHELFDALSWGARIFTINCRRLLHVFAGEPEIYETKYFKNPNHVPDTVSGIVDPGPEYGLDERHFFCRLTRALLAVPEAQAPYSDAARNFREAALQEIHLLLKHRPCEELIDYWDALRSLLSIVFQKTRAFTPPEEYRRQISEKCLELAHTRKLLYKRYRMEESNPTPPPAEHFTTRIEANSQAIQALGGKIDETHASLGGKIDKAAQDVKQAIGGKIDETSQAVKALGGKIDYTRSYLSDKMDGKSQEENPIRKAMVDRGLEALEKFPKDAPNGHWRQIYSEYQGLPGAYTSFNSYRRQIQRKLGQRRLS